MLIPDILSNKIVFNIRIKEVWFYDDLIFLWSQTKIENFSNEELKYAAHELENNEH